MKQLKTMAGCLCLCLAAGCTSPASQQENVAVTEGMTQSDAVIKTIMERRSVRKYKLQPVNRDTMQTILNCGINAPNGQNKQSWAIRVVDNPDYINGLTEIYKRPILRQQKIRISRICSAMPLRLYSLLMILPMTCLRLIADCWVRT